MKVNPTDGTPSVQPVTRVEPIGKANPFNQPHSGQLPSTTNRVSDDAAKRILAKHNMELTGQKIVDRVALLKALFSSRSPKEGG